MRVLCFLLMLVWAGAALAEAPEVQGFQLEARGEKVILRLKLSDMVEFTSFTLEHPDRVVLDLKSAKWNVPKADKSLEKLGFVTDLRAGRPVPETLRVVLDLTRPAAIEDAFIQVPPRNSDPHYLVVQMKPLQPAAAAPEEKNFAKPQAATVEKPKTEIAAAPPPPAPPAVPAPFIPVPKPRPERFIIVIDPGHGGVDPGTIGAQGAKEKNITLRYAKHLREVLYASPRYTVVMTRDDDTYIPLKGRVKIAQEAQGDLFISLHADSHPDPTMHGLSVYTLSEQASDKESAALAERENKENIITGVDLSAQSQDIAEVLIDLAQRDTKNTSARFAELVVNELGTEAKLLKHTHRFAGFAVLKGVNTPSVLVEMGYLSNPKEEAQLISTEYEDNLVHAIARAVDTYCDQYAPKEQGPTL